VTSAIDLVRLLRAALPSEFQVDDYLDAGGQGAVFRGKYRGEDAALKVFAASQDPRRLEREIALLQQLDHPNVVRIRAVTSVNLSGQVCWVVAYEFLSGGDLRNLLSPAQPPISGAQLSKIGDDISAAIEALWIKRIVHRDIKPANIVIADPDRYVLVDLGLARHLDRSTLTLVGFMVGTQGYMSPEQARGRRHLTIHSDVFSLGVTLYELASQQHPFQRNQGLIGARNPLSLSTLRGDLPTSLTSLIEQMMAVSPALRPTGLSFRFNQMQEVL